MPPDEAVKSLFINWSDFGWRATRSEFWWGVGFVFLAQSLAALADAAASTQAAGPAVTLLTLVPQASLHVRRLHDVGRSGWWAAAPLVPLAILVVSVFLGILLGDVPRPRPFLGMVTVGATLALAFMVLGMYCARGERGNNAYGADPSPRSA